MAFDTDAESDEIAALENRVRGTQRDAIAVWEFTKSG
jgi:hypothetical protein